MATPTNETDPNGLAVLIIAAVTPTVTVLGLLLKWSTDLSGYLTAALVALVNLGVALWAVWRARRHAYAPATVERIQEVNNRIVSDPPVV